MKCFYGIKYKFDGNSSAHTIVVRNSYDKYDSHNVYKVQCDKVVMVKTNVTVSSMREPLISVDNSVSFVPVNNVLSSTKSTIYKSCIVFGNEKLVLMP